MDIKNILEEKAPELYEVSISLMILLSSAHVSKSR
jgi:hypothetical protein